MGSAAEAVADFGSGSRGWQWVVSFGVVWDPVGVDRGGVGHGGDRSGGGSDRRRSRKWIGVSVVGSKVEARRTTPPDP